MHFSDKFLMAWSSLTKRKLRTMLTIMGVTIGVAAIVTMMALGEGLKQQSLEMIEQFGGLRTITVREGSGKSSADANAKTDAQATKFKLSDETIKSIEAIDHVEKADPQLSVSAIAKAGKYTFNAYIVGMKLSTLKSERWEMAEGGWPDENDELEFVYGNMVKQDFMDVAGKYPYYDKGEMPDYDIMNKPIYFIYDVDGYNSYKNKSTGSTGQTSNSGTLDKSASSAAGSGSTSTTTSKAPKKYLVPTAGILAGGAEDWSEYSYNLYCDMDKLIKVLKKEFKNKAIPGQPTRKNGKPYNQMFYTQIDVEVDDVENISEVQNIIKDMGFDASSNSEWIEQEKQTARSRQAMLGGIGAVSLLVAAIGIANTMMMSIYERTKEIGVMKVLGCGLFDIQQLFLIEAGMIGLGGGITGLLLSIIASFVINKVTAATTAVIPLWMYPVSVIFAILVSMIAGYAPSKRAMSLSALEAIRSN